MIDPEREGRAQELIEGGDLSLRGIARETGISRGKISEMARGKRPMDLSRQRAERREPPPSGPAVRCPGCGGLVVMPCRACRIRRRRANDTQPRTYSIDPRDDESLSIALRDEDQERYLIVRGRKDAELRAMLDDAERRAREDPRDDLEPTDDELAAIEAECS